MWQLNTNIYTRKRAKLFRKHRLWQWKILHWFRPDWEPITCQSKSQGSHMFAIDVNRNFCCYFWFTCSGEFFFVLAFDYLLFELYEFYPLCTLFSFNPKTQKIIRRQFLFLMTRWSGVKIKELRYIFMPTFINILQLRTLTDAKSDAVIPKTQLMEKFIIKARNIDIKKSFLHSLNTQNFHLKDKGFLSSKLSLSLHWNNIKFFLEIYLLIFVTNIENDLSVHQTQTMPTINHFLIGRYYIRSKITIFSIKFIIQ